MPNRGCVCASQIQNNLPTYILLGLAVAVVLLTIGQSFHEEPSEEQSHYMTLGIKRMCKSEEIQTGYEKAKSEMLASRAETLKETQQ